MIDLDGAVACVTGGARGIGRATAVELGRRGARVWIGDVDAEAAAVTATEIGCRSMHLDVTKADSVGRFWAAANADGPVRMLVNNAGIMRLGSFIDQDLDGHHREVAINLMGPINGMHVFLPDMLARNEGHVVNVASMAAKVTTPGIAVYCATKFAVAAVSRAVRAEIADTAVTITTVLPAAVTTELVAGVSLDLQPTLSPERVARAIVDTAHRPGHEVTVPRWLAPMGLVEEAAPERILNVAKRIVTGRRPPGHFDDDARRAYLDRIGG
jgi:short-subunit dehydrogenase